MLKLSHIWLFMLLGSVLLSGCGFQLRGELPLAKYPAIYLEGNRHSELLAKVTEQLKRNNVTLLTEADNKTPHIRLLSDGLQRRTLSLFPNGQVAEYELIYTVEYQLLMPGKDATPYKIELYRDYQDDPSRALAKARELDLLLDELRTQAAARLIRQLGRL